MPHNFRFAVWAAVSTEEQVKDKDSLANQVRDCRAYAERLGGVETCEPFIADGYSRSAYEGLSEAMEDIPPLKAAIAAAMRNEYDVLLVRYFDRLGSIAEMVFTRFKKLKKQLRSVQEATPILPPHLYDPLKDDSTMTQIKIASIYQEGRINRIISNQKENMPRRVREGLTPSRIPYGYIYVSNKQPPTLDPAKAARLIQARDLLLEGESLKKIGALLGVDPSRVRTVLSNPYYAGVVAYNKSYILHSGMKRQQIHLPKSKWTTGAGRHQAIFTQAEHERILAEFERRDELKRRSKVDFVFSGLLRCAVCGERARQHWFGNPGKKRRVITCRSGYSDHVVYEYVDFLEQTIEAIRSKLRDHQEGEGVSAEDKSMMILEAIEATKKQVTKVQEGFMLGIFDAAEAARKKRDLEQEAERLHKKLEQDAAARVAQEEAEKTLQEVIYHLEEYILDRDPHRVNRLLAAYIQEIRVGKQIEVIKR